MKLRAILFFALLVSLTQAVPAHAVSIATLTSTMAGVPSSAPRGIAVGSDGSVYFGDTNNQRVLRVSFDSNGTPTTTTVAGGNGEGGAANQLNFPYGIAIDSNNVLYIADKDNHRVQRVTFDGNGDPEPATTFAGGNGPGAAANQLNRPRGVTAAADGTVYIADSDNLRVQRVMFDLNGDPEAATTVAGGNGYGAAANQLILPGGTALDSEGSLFIADIGNHRIQRVTFDSNGNPETATTVAGGNSPGAASNQFNMPADLASDSSGNLYVADLSNDRVQMVRFADGGATTITVAGGNYQGSADDQLDHPNDVAIGADGTLYIADSNNSRVQLIKVDQIAPSSTSATTPVRVGQTGTLAYSCQDTGGAGLATCTAALNGTSADNGDTFNFPVRGSHRLDITAVDNHGNSTTTTSYVRVDGKREITGTHAASSGMNGSIARLYMATFGRNPDDDGFAYWRGRHNDGASLRDIANFFASSAEFQAMNGDATDTEFTELLYNHVMGRSSDSEGLAYWTSRLEGGLSRAHMLAWFSESPEFKTRTYTS